MVVIRSKNNISNNKSLYLITVNGRYKPTVSQTVDEVFQIYKSDDGFLHLNCEILSTTCNGCYLILVIRLKNNFAIT